MDAITTFGESSFDVMLTGAATVGSQATHFNADTPVSARNWRTFMPSNDAACAGASRSLDLSSDDARRTPRYFHIMSDLDLDQLRSLARTTVARRRELVSRFYRNYALSFGDARTLSEPEFVQLFEPAVEQSKSALLRGDFDEYRSHVTHLGESLAKRGMPLEEAVATLQLYKESLRGVFAEEVSGGVDAALDRLAQVRVLLMMSAYLQSHSAVSGARLVARQSEAANLPPAATSRFHGLVGGAPDMRQLYQRIQAAGAVSCNLLVVGESGTGKELVARAIHECGPRRGKPFVALNCAALPKDLIESELFGYKRGAFSGATAEHLGLFRAAEGGTLFLDEITEMDAATQSKLLRALQERAIRPVGSTQEQPVDVRVIASTNRDPKEAVADGHLRSDLYYRLQASVLNIPALREHREDIPMLVDHFIALFGERVGRNVAGIDQSALEAMMQYSWPGNVRELANAIEGAFTFGKAPLIGLDDLPAPAFAASLQRRPPVMDFSGAANGHVPSFADAERDLVAGALRKTNGNKVAAAQLLGVSRKKLYAKIAKYSLAGVSLD